MVVQFLKLISVILITLSFFSCYRQGNNSIEYSDPQHQIPRVLIITTGLESSETTLPKGIVIALQAFNQKGAMVRLEPRDILYQPDELKKFNVLLLSTSLGYHDADRKYSLSFMSNDEMKNICEFVQAGGILIAGDNVGRNEENGTDRIVLHGRLSSDNYPLANCFGLELVEKKMDGFRIYGHLSGNENQYIRPVAENYLYTLVADTLLSNQIKIMANWVSEQDTIPAIIKNQYGKGSAYLLASSEYFHPADDGGLVSTTKISNFYHEVIEDFCNDNAIPIQLNPWPSGHKYAFCVTMNSEGNLTNYQRVRKLLKKYNLTADYFVNGNVSNEVRNYLKHENNQLHSNGFAFDNYRKLNYSQSVSDILKNEQVWGQNFSGFRFPYTMPGFWGMMALSEHNYIFESSIGANNMEFIHGSVVPYNIVIAKEGFYHSTEILELAPTYHDDYYFLHVVESLRKKSPQLVIEKTQLYKKYLENFWEYAVKPFQGVMVYQGHPGYVANNDTTLTALENLLKVVQHDNAWTASASEIACFRRNLTIMQFYVKNETNKIIVNVLGPESISIDNVCLNLDFEPKKADASIGKARIQSDSLQYYVVFNALSGQKISIYK